MSSDCRPSTEHQLSITLSLKGILTIEFPHSEWASTFCDFIKESPGEKKRNRNPYIPDRDFSQGCYVRLSLKDAVNRVQFLGTDEHGGSVIFAFTNVKMAGDWLENSGLWLAVGGAKLKLPSRWSHEKFEKAMRKNNDGEKDGGEKKVLSQQTLKKNNDSEKDEGDMELVSKKARKSSKR